LSYQSNKNRITEKGGAVERSRAQIGTRGNGSPKVSVRNLTGVKARKKTQLKETGTGGYGIASRGFAPGRAGLGMNPNWEKLLMWGGGGGESQMSTSNREWGERTLYDGMVGGGKGTLNAASNNGGFKDWWAATSKYGGTWRRTGG